MVALINFDTAPNLPVTPGFFAGWSIVAHTLELTDANHGTSSGTNEFYKARWHALSDRLFSTVGVRFE